MLCLAPTAAEAERRLDQTLARLPSPLPKDQLRKLFVAGHPDAVCRQVQEHLDAGLDGLVFSFPHGVSPEEVAFAGRTLSTVLVP